MSTDERLARARCSLEGLSVGDAFGEQFFLTWELIQRIIQAGLVQGPPYDVDEFIIEQMISMRGIPTPPPWRYTDDTQMALSVVESLRLHEKIEPDHLAVSFGEHYEAARGYGAAMHDLLPRYRAGESWQQSAHALFGGTGSYGNGAAMRVAPVGAYFADDLDAVVENAACSAAVTHAHPEGVAGAIAVAVAAAQAWRVRDANPLPTGADFLELVLANVPESEVKRLILEACDLPDVEDVTVEEVVETLGNGSEISAQDTVPFVLWCAAQHLNSYEEALWFTVSGLGDRDTTCAMVGGIVVMCCGEDSIPTAWSGGREPLPSWPFK